LSGSSALTFLPGLARSGSTHSFEGLANTFPAEEEVSLLPLPEATGAWTEAVVEVETELTREVMGGRAGMGIFAEILPLALPLLDPEGRARMVEEEEAEGVGREMMLEFIEALRGRGTATDIAVSRGVRRSMLIKRVMAM